MEVAHPHSPVQDRIDEVDDENEQTREEHDEDNSYDSEVAEAARDGHISPKVMSKHRDSKGENVFRQSQSQINRQSYDNNAVGRSYDRGSPLASS